MCEMCLEAIYMYGGTEGLRRSAGEGVWKTGNCYRASDKRSDGTGSLNQTTKTREMFEGAMFHMKSPKKLIPISCTCTAHVIQLSWNFTDMRSIFGCGHESRDYLIR